MDLPNTWLQHIPETIEHHQTVSEVERVALVLLRLLALTCAGGLFGKGFLASDAERRTASMDGLSSTRALRGEGIHRNGETTPRTTEKRKQI